MSSFLNHNVISSSHRGVGPMKGNLLEQTAIVIPTFNAGDHWPRLHSALEKQGVSKEQILIIDSSSTDGTAGLARSSGYQLIEIRSESFRHGGTRQMAADLLPWARFLVYLTQDAVPSDGASIRRLLEPFRDPSVGAAYGRQLPRLQANPIERHARLFNYPAISHIRSYAHRRTLGIRAAFFSNSFAAYRRSAFDEVNGFPKNTIVSEDVSVAAQMLLAGWRIAYAANAKVFHSHSLTLSQEFSRYFDIGVHHYRERALMQQFGGPSGEGVAFVLSEIHFLWESQPSLIPLAALRNLSKWVSYNLGIRERHIPLLLKKAISAQSQFWRDEGTRNSARRVFVTH